MPDVNTEVDDLIHDAELVRAFAARAGLLTDDRLSRAIREARETAQSGASTDMAALATALSDAIKTISPMTLVDLREGRSAFDSASKKGTARLQSVLSLFSIVLVALIAYVMVSLQREQEALLQIEKVVDTRTFEKLGTLRRMAQYEGVFETLDAKYDNYRQKLFELQQLQEKVSTAYFVVYQAKETPIFPFQPALTSALASLFTSSKGEKDKGEPNVVIVQSADNQADPSGADTADPCELDPAKVVKTNSWLGKVSLDALSDFCFSREALGNPVTTQKLLNYVVEFKEGVALKSGWILPFLYGLLGASIYLMRSQLSTRTATITAVPAFLRIALGGVAGIAVGWFGATGSAGSSAVVASSLPFALAFLAGFSIDVLFSLLDRFNRVLTEQAKPKGGD